DAPHGAGEAIPSRELVVSGSCSPEPLDLGRGYDAAIGRVALRPDATLAVPPPQRVEADAEQPSRLGRGVHLPRHFLGKPTREAATPPKGRLAAQPGPRPARSADRRENGDLLAHSSPDPSSATVSACGVGDRS